MCGRYAAARETEAVVAVLSDLGIRIGEVSEEARSVPPSYNVAPTRVGVVAVAPRPAGENADSPEAPGWRMEALSWGLVPSWAKDTRGGSRMINARVETLADKPAFRGLLRSRRCLVPADGWFEWQAAPGSSNLAKQPFLVHPVEDPLLMFAGLFTWWRERAGDRREPGPWFGSYTVLTTAADPELAWLHDRMPVALPRDAWSDWVPTTPAPGELDDSAARHLLADALAAGHPRLGWHPVDRRVGAVANDDPSLVRPWVPATE